MRPSHSLYAVFVATMVPNVAHAASVLLIYDTKSGDTASLVTTLTAAGHVVTYSNTDETGYNGTNPAPTAFDVVIHLNGTTYSSGMPAAGQTALVSYVSGGGGFIESEWDAYEIDDTSTMTTMKDIVILERVDGREGAATYSTVSGKASHEVLKGITSGMSFDGGISNGAARTYSSDPVEVLMTDDLGNDAVMVREWGVGRIVGFSHAGNYGSYGTLADADIQDLYVNAVAWASASCSGTTDADGDGDDSVSCGGTDCNDADDSIYAGARETWYDGVDSDCGGESDYDKDGDGDDRDSDGGTDCDDTDNDVNGLAEEIWYDGVDNDCSGGSDYDQDGDGDDREADGGTDCDDTDDSVFVGAREIELDGIDQDCNGVDSGVDSDADGLTDDVEVDDLGTDPHDNDTDGDGLDDGDEFREGTDPLERDSDGGGVDDGDEVLAGTDPMNPDDDHPDEDTGDNTDDTGGDDSGNDNDDGFGDFSFDDSGNDNKSDDESGGLCGCAAEGTFGSGLGVLTIAALTLVRRRRG